MLLFCFEIMIWLKASHCYYSVTLQVLNNGYCELRNEMDALCEEKLANDDVSVVSVFLALPCGVAASTDDGTGSLQGWPPLARAPLPLAPLYLKPRRQNESASLSCHRARTCTKALIRLPARRTDTLCTLTRWLTVAPCDLRFVRVQFFVYFLLCRFC